MSGTGLGPEYVRALDAFDRHRWDLAFALAAPLAARVPAHGDVQFIAGAAALQLGRLPAATGFLQRAVECEPDRVEYRAQLARALAMQHRMQEAVTEAERVAMGAPRDAAVWDTIGVVFSKAQAHDRAATAFGMAVERAPSNPAYRFNSATSLMYAGELDEAEREFETCLSADPGQWRAHLALSHMRRQTGERNHVDRLRGNLARPLSPEARAHLDLALAKELEDLGRFGEALDHYIAGKRAFRNVLGPSSDQDTALFDAVEGYFRTPLPAAEGFPTDEPVFVVGMPRTGTTLLDRILASHGQVSSAGELGHFGAALQRAARPPIRSLADIVDHLPLNGLDWADLGRSYLDSTRPMTGHAPRFVDKMPHNFLYLGFIARALPGARIICVRRDPMDTCLSNFRQLFAPESAYHRYSFDLLDTARYYLRFHRLMERWKTLFPGRIHEVRYERLVDAQREVTAGILEFCGLPWDERCLAFERADGPVATASAVQVRSGLNRESVHRWRRYGSRLDDLRRLLEEGGVTVE